ncbi:MAG: hypothetical protein ACRD5I_05735, partial [Candidatus Acidiferrales bacterium]
MKPRKPRPSKRFQRDKRRGPVSRPPKFRPLVSPPRAPSGPSGRPAALRTSPLRVSVVKYLNTAPLVWGLERGPLKGRYRLSYT